MTTGQTIAYVRVSTEDQNTARQIEALASINADKTFEDKASGKDTGRPQLQAALSHMREGDTFVIYSIDRLSRSLIDLVTTVKSLSARGIEVRFIKENLTFKPGTSDHMSNLILSIMGSLAEWEREIIRERQAQGIAIAKAKGLYKGRKASLTSEQVQELQSLAVEGVNVSELSRKFEVSRPTVYKYLQKH